MAILHFLGTCSGTEPMPGMHHTSWVLEVGDAYYWFDAGEGCAHTAYTSGMDVTRTRALFISHPHVDHIGGLANLLHCFHKLGRMHQLPMRRDNALDVYFPDPEVFEAIKTVVFGRKGGGKFPFLLREKRLTEGVLYEDELVRVSAIPNLHMGEGGESGRCSFSFLIEAEGKRIVFSGDVKHPEELDPFLTAAPADLLIMETGHHAVQSVCDYAVSRQVRRLRLIHHGREILRDRAAAEGIVAAVSASHPISAVIAYDGMRETV